MIRGLLCVAVMALGTWAAWGDTFEKHPKRFVVGPNPCFIVAPDLNGDAIPEIITADRGDLTSPNEERPANDELSLLIAHERLSYTKSPPFRSGFAPYAVVIANIDDLKAPDVVVGSFLAARNRDLSLFRNLGENLFETSHYSISDDVLQYTKNRDGDNRAIFTTPGITSLIAGDKDDFNHDGYRDVVATCWSSDVLAFFPGGADPYFGQAKLTELAGGPRDLVARDFDGDGETDLAVLLYNVGEIALLKGDGQGGFELEEHFPTHGNLPTRLKCADINGDGKDDLVVSHCYADDSFTIHYSSKPFRYDLTQEIVLGSKRDAVEHEIRDLVVTDLNGDERPDLALACFESRTVRVFLNTSKDHSVPQTFAEEIYTFKDARPRALCVADFNGDGRLDLGVALWEANAVALLLGTGK